MRKSTTFPEIANETAMGHENSLCFSSDSTAAKIFKVCGYCVILLASIFGNILIIIIVYKNRELRKSVNYFIVNMAVLDLLFPCLVPRRRNLVERDALGVMGLIVVVRKALWDRCKRKVQYFRTIIPRAPCFPAIPPLPNSAWGRGWLFPLIVIPVE